MRRNWLKKMKTSRVVVYTDAQCYEGVLDAVASDGVVLFDAVVRTDDDVKLAGRVYVPRESVRCVQIP